MNKVPDIANDNLLYFGERVEPYFASAMVAGGLVNKEQLKQVFDLQTPARWIQVNQDYFNVKSDVEQLVQEVRDKLKHEGKPYVDRLVAECFTAGEKLLTTAKDISKRASKENLTQEDLANLLDEYFKAASQYCIYYNIAFFDKPEMELAERLAEKYAASDEERKELYELITSPSQETDAEREQDDFLRLCIQLRDNQENIDRLAAEHAAKYGYLVVRFFVGNPLTKEDVLARLEAADKSLATETLEKRIKHREEIKEGLENLFARIEPSDRALVEQIRDIVFLRSQRADFYHHSAAIVQPLVREIAERLGLTYDELLYFHPQEVSAALRGTYNIQADLKDRQEIILIYHAEDGAVISGAAATEYLKDRPILNRKAEQVTELQGRTAYKGIVTGPAKIVMRPEDATKVNRGDILVAIMTTPNLIAAMEKASAFVTDEGGITCHAAIIAREMKKPCITATKSATKVLKDGDIVEVNADNGTVKVLEDK